MLIPLQYAVVVGVAISILMFVIGQSSRLVVRRVTFRDDGRAVESDPPEQLPPGEVVVLQPYGAIFFASAAALLEQMPVVTPTSRDSVVILRLRGTDDAGSTLLDVLDGYARSLAGMNSRLVVVTDNERIIRQLHDTGTIASIGPDNVYRGTAVIGETVRRAHDDAIVWIASRDEGEDA
jgi:SulP family sulfate permease